jgi:P4 family phage/plasmid primase-like protien
VTDLTAQQRADLDVARVLASAGVPLFLASADASAKTGYRPPPRWEQTVADPAVVDAWRPGLALCAVMGHRLDLIDIDPRNGGDPAAIGRLLPLVYASASTPSGGRHLFVAAMGCGSRDNVFPGIDVKSGAPDGTGRGFAFIAPTVRASVVTGELAPYRWHQQAALRSNGLGLRDGDDTTGAALAGHIRELRAAGTGMRSTGGPDWWQTFLSAREPQSAPAAERAITGKLAEVSGWSASGGVGFRAVLLRAALTLGGYVGGGYLDEEIARKRLDAAVSEVWGSPDADDLLWIQQGLDDGAVQPFHVYSEADAREHSELARSIAAQGEAPPDAENSGGRPDGSGPAWSVFSVLGGEAFDPAQDGSDQGLAKAVAARMYPALRLCFDSGSWIVRERDVWVEHTDDLSDWAVSTVAELMPLGATPVPKEVGERTEQHWQAVRRAQFLSSAGSSKVARKLRAITRMSHPIALRASQLDNNPEVLWAGGVPWDLRASIETPTPAFWIDPGTPHLRTALVAPDAECPTPRWDAFVAAVWPDLEVRRWALRVLSIALTGYPDAALPVLYGPERSGKTSLAQMLVTLLGSYAHAASPKLLSSQDTSHPEMIWDLKGRRLSFIDEGPRRGHDATERLKQITGGGSLTGRAMRANSVTFDPSHTLVMTTNDEPHLTDPALRARMRLIPCDATERDVRPARLPLLGRGLTTEAPGILAALMTETAAYLDDRDSAGNAAGPESVRGLVADLAAMQDPVQQWVEDCTVPAEPGTLGRTLHTAFARWHADHPVFRKTVIPSETSFGKSLTALGYPSRHTHFGKLRPLSIVGFSGFPEVRVPSPSAFLGRTGPTTETVVNDVSGPCTVADQANSDPVTEQNSRSEPVFDSSSDWLTSSDNNNQSKINTPSIRDIRNTTDAGSHSSPVRPSPPTLSDVASRASSEKISKAEARLRIKEEARQASISSASGEVLSLPAVVDRDGNIVPVTTDQAAAIVATAVTRSGALTVDVETTGFPLGHHDYALRSVQLGDATAAVVLHPVEHAETITALLAGAPVLHAHSATADLAPLAAAGLVDADSAWQRMHDTVIPAKLADPASTGSDPGLKKLAAAVLGDRSVAPTADAGRAALFKAGRWLTDTKIHTPVERSGWAQVDPRCATMLRYAASDVLDTGALAAVLPRPDPAIYERERLAQRMTARVTHAGIRLDAAHIAELTGQHQTGRAAAAAALRALGVDKPGSDQQIGAAASQFGAELPMTPTGRPSVAAGVLEPLRGSDGALGELVGAVLDYRHHDTALGLFLEPYRLLCDRGDGRARPTVYTLGTDTGRMACVRPNLQQMSRQGGIRACLTADPGQLMVGADFSGVEIRVAAALSQDANLLKMLTDGRDLHAEIARLVWGPDATKAHRYKAKPMVFQRLYGGSVPGLAKQAGVTLEVAQAVVDALDALTPQLSAWSSAISQAVRRGQTQFTSYAGRVIHLPRDRPHAAPNYCVALDTPILRSDLRHVPASEIRPGDRLVAFDEHTAETGRPVNYRRMRTATAEAVSIVRKHSVVVRAGDGKATTCSADHLWLVRPLKQPSHGVPRTRWVRADELRPGDSLLSLGTWTESGSRTGGYLAGLYDGEGSMQLRGESGGATGLSFSQLPGRVMDEFCAEMDAAGLRFSYYTRSPNSTSPTDTVRVCGVRNLMRVLGTLQPRRFQSRFESVYDGAAITAGLTESVAVLSVEDVGEVDLVSIQTSTRTLVANGYLSHNCIQGSARELLVDALVKWRDTRWGSCVLLPVHDELDVFVPAEDADAATAELVACMQAELFGVRIEAAPAAPSFAWADSA